MSTMLFGLLRVAVFAALIIATVVPFMASLSRRAVAESPTVLRLASAEPESLNPAFSIAWNGVPRLVFSYLTTIGPNGERDPDVATEVPTLENGGFARDGRSVTFHLRKDVRWQDGEPLTAADCVFTLKRLADPKTNAPSIYELANIDAVTAPDPYTLVVHLKRVGPLAAQGLLSEDTFPILPAHLLATVVDLKDADFNQRPIGSGPYRVREWVRGDHVTLDANPMYFRGRPKIDEIRLMFISDANTIVNELRSGELDGALILDRSVYPQTRSILGMRNVLTPMPGMATIFMNVRSGVTADIRIRRAIAATIDAAYIAKTTWPGQPLTGSARQYILGLPYSDAASPRPDRAKVESLLDAAGWHSRGDGFRYRDGVKLELSLAILAGQPSYSTASVTIQAELREVGIDLTIRTYQLGLLLSPQGPFLTGKFDLGMLTPTLDNHDTGMIYSCSAIPPNGYNMYRICDSHVDSAEQAQASAFNIAGQKRANALLENYLEADVPEVILWQQHNLSVYSVRLHGVDPSPVTPYIRAWEWYLADVEK